jgi:hypothetical protein
MLLGADKQSIIYQWHFGHSQLKKDQNQDLYQV